MECGERFERTEVISHVAGSIHLTVVPFLSSSSCLRVGVGAGIQSEGPVSQKALTQGNRCLVSVPAVSLNLLCALVEVAAPLWASTPSFRLHTGQWGWNKEVRS